MKQPIKRRFFHTRFFDARENYSDSLPYLCFLGLLTGIAVALVISLFHALFKLPLAYFSLDGGTQAFAQLSDMGRFALPALGGLALGLMLTLIKPAAHATGVGHVIYCTNQHQGKMPLGNALVQMFAGSLAIATGQSAGREGPAVHLGAALSSFIGQRAGLSVEHLRVLVACGAAGAIAASFNTPMTGVVFAIEVVLLQYSFIGFLPIIIAAVTAVIIHNGIAGQGMQLMAQNLTFSGIKELPLVFVCGLIFGVLATVFTIAVKKCSQYNHVPVFWRMLIAGIVTGLLATQVPYIMGTGVDSISEAIHGNYGMALLLAIVVAKLLATSISVGLGMPVGIIGPSIFIGACAGSALGMVINIYFPDIASSHGFYALLGMCAILSAVLQAPLAGLIALLELTDNPHIILPGMVTVVVTNITYRYLFKQDATFIEIFKIHHTAYDHIDEPHPPTEETK